MFNKIRGRLACYRRTSTLYRTDRRTNRQTDR